MDKVFAMIDCNSFFCSCERLFDPTLKDRPVIVLSNNDGCAVARTPEAKALGIKMGEPYFKIRDLCDKHRVAVFSSNFSLYTNLSDRVMNVLKDLGTQIEVYSVDEAWIDITGLTNDYLAYGRKIKNIVERAVGIPVGVGIAPTKTMSKLANHIAKKSTKAQGVVDLTNSKYWDEALKRVAVEDIWGIGFKSAQKLNALGLKTAYDFSRYHNEVLIQKLLNKTGLQRKQELQGIRCFELDLIASKKKVIRSSRTFGAPVYEKNDLKQAVANFVTAACEKLRAQQSVCSTITVFARTSPYKNTPQYYAYEGAHLEVATKDTRKLIKAAWSLVDQFYRGGFEYKKAGVELHNIIDESEAQLNLFTPCDSKKDDELMRLMDRLNYYEGHEALKSLACGVNNKAWRMLRDYKSERFTTSWWELPKVK